MLTGVIPGIYLLEFANDRILRSTLGIVVMEMAVEMLIRNSAQKMTKKSNPVFLIIIGVISGVLGFLRKDRLICLLQRSYINGIR